MYIHARDIAFFVSHILVFALGALAGFALGGRR